MKNVETIIILLLKINLLLLPCSCQREILDSSETYEGFLGAIPTSVLPHSDVTSFGQLCSFDEFVIYKLSIENTKEFVAMINRLEQIHNKPNYDFRSAIYLRTKNKHGIKICFDILSRDVMIGDTHFSMNDELVKYIEDNLYEHLGKGFCNAEYVDIYL